MDSRPLTLMVPCFVLAAGCGGDPSAAGLDAHPGPLEVRADPPGGTFEGALHVEITASAPSRIFYTLDGSPPTGPSALEYDGPVAIEQAALLTFVAVDERGVWSNPRVELYAESRPSTPSAVPRRALALDRDAIFFHVEDGEAAPERVRLRSVGLEPVRVLMAGIASHAGGAFFFEDGVFSLENPLPGPVALAPGEALELELRYRPTETLRGAALMVLSEDERTPDGVHVVQLWGRIFGW
jgi:hypothetical protein